MAKISRKDRKRIVVVGLGRFGSNMARALHQQGHDVLAIDKNEQIINKIKGNVSYAVVGDATHEDVLNELGVPEFDIGIVAIGNDEKDSIMVALLLTSLKLDYVVARAHSELHASTLARLGCNRVVRVEEEMGRRVATNLLEPDIPHLDTGRENRIATIRVRNREAGNTLSELLKIRQNKQNTKEAPADLPKVLFIVREMKRGKESDIIWDTADNTRLQEKDSIVMFGSNDLINSFA